MALDFPFKSTKTWHEAFPVAYRQHRADSHCSKVHGYALSVHLEFGGFELDVRNWLVDFGSLRGLKGQLEDWFDHTLLVAQDDPHREALLELGRLKIAKITEVERTGCEGLADFIFEHLNDGWLRENGYGGRIVCTKVEVRETDANMAMRCLDQRDYERFCGGLRRPVDVPRPYTLREDSYGGFTLTRDVHFQAEEVVQAHRPGFSHSLDGSKLFLTAEEALHDLIARLQAL